MKLSVIGTGYVGLVSGVCFAETGNTVICVDNDLKKVEQLQSAKLPIYEPELDAFFQRNVQQHRLSFTSDLKAAIDFADIIFLALPTPPYEDGSADLSYVLGVAEEIGTLLDTYKIIVDKSTVPIGTSDLVRKAIEKNCTVQFDVVSNPEFLREGIAVEDFLNPDRVIIGTRSEKAKQVMADLYRPFTKQGKPILFMDERSAEMTKYVANSYLATRITFMNEVANICERLDADVDMVRRGIGSDHRIGSHFLYAGVGYGGSCFPKDVKAFLKMSESSGYPFSILESVEEVNQKQRVLFLEKVLKYFNHDLIDKKIALWGLAFKPNTDDIREAPAIDIIRELISRGVDVHVFDPEATEHVKAIFGDQITYHKSQYTVIEKAHALLILTEWNMFRTPDFEKMRELLASPVIFDGRNIYKTDVMEKLSFHYESIGRRVVSLT